MYSQKGFGQIIYLILILIGVAAVGVYYYLSSKGVPVEKNNPTYTQLIPDTPDPITSTPQITIPKENSTITSPVIVEGTVPAGWMFEGEFPIKIINSEGKIASFNTGKENVPGSWTSGLPVEFTVRLDYPEKTYSGSTGYIVFEKSNPGGLPENDSEFKIMVYFK